MIPSEEILEKPIYTFSRTAGDAFCRNLGLHFESLFHEFVDRPTTYLEVGVFEGRSAILMLECVLRHPDSRLLGVDRWGMPDTTIEPNARENLNHFDSKVCLHKGTMRSAVNEEQWSLESVDIAYHDGSKKVLEILEASLLMWSLLKPGGVFIWDDYMWPGKSKTCDPHLAPKVAIDAFLSCIEGSYTLLFKNWQLAVRKE